MQVTITDSEGQVFVLDISEDLEVENFKALCSFESKIPVEEMTVTYDGRLLHDPKKPLNSFGVKNGDMIFIQRQAAQRATRNHPSNENSRVQNGPLSGFPDFSSIQIPSLASTSNSLTSGRGGNQTMPQMSENDPNFPKYLMQELQKHPGQRSLLKQNNPRLSEALESGDLKMFTNVLSEQQKQKRDKELQRIRVLTADPFDPEAQRLIAEEIRQENVDQNMEHALEHAPESFGQVIMLYIECFVNGHPVKAFVDSGAQTTIMSRTCAERCGIMRLVDTRWRGIAKGVGQQTIIGKVHLGTIKIGNDYLSSSFSILLEQPMDMLLGLDMLKRHQCVIDLKNNELVIGTTGSKTSFLAESDLPECAKLNRQLEDMTEDERLDKVIKESSNTSSSSSNKSSTSGRTFPKEDIDKLVVMGFSKEQAIQGLISSSGDVSKAAAMILAMNMPKPMQ